VAIQEKLFKLEEWYLTERELKAIRAGKRTTVRLEQVMKRAGIKV
jgi:hypothetical protein